MYPHSFKCEIHLDTVSGTTSYREAKYLLDAKQYPYLLLSAVISPYSSLSGYFNFLLYLTGAGITA